MQVPGRRRHALLVAAVLGMLVLVASFAPWFQHEYSFVANGASGVRTDSANAWNASWWWACGCALGALAGALVFRRSVTARHRWFTTAAAFLSMLAVAAILIEYLPLLRQQDVGGEGYFTYATLTQGDAGNLMGVRRGALAVVKVDDYEARVGWGLYVGLALLLAQLLTLAAAGITKVPVARAAET